MSALTLSVLLCLVSAVCYAAAAIVQERIAALPGGGARQALRRPGWWGAVALTALGAGLHVLALAYGPLSVVQPLGALTIVFALPMAAWFVRRPVGAAGWRGALLATAGLAGLLTLTGPPRTEHLAGSERPALALAVLGAMAGLMLAAHWMRRPVVRGVVLATAAGAAFGMASVFTKAVAEDLTDHHPAALGVSLGAIALLAPAGMLISQAAYRGAGLAAPLATLTVVNPVVAAAVGTLVLGEAFRYGLTGGLLALLAGAVTAAGVVVLTFREAELAAQEPGITAELGPAASDPATGPGLTAEQDPAAELGPVPVLVSVPEPDPALQPDAALRPDSAPEPDSAPGPWSGPVPLTGREPEARVPRARTRPRRMTVRCGSKSPEDQSVRAVVRACAPRHHGAADP
ncbi:DMT family transporter [Streptomyces orinoci]|uniref:DMT family transporter n=1 Tax=Streptomyces orinoci TaxID=67339 RepID=A0ABV3K4A3_STRON|nr:DMT family transporter [Streptomyces orinoci]